MATKTGSGSASSKKHVIEITLMGQKVVLKTQADPKLVEEVTALVLDRLAASERRVKNANAPHLAALLALFDVAEDYVEAKRKIQLHQAELMMKVQQLQSWVDSELNS